MARKTKSKASVYERIEDTLQKIKNYEEQLAELRVFLNELYAEKDDLEMRQTWATINEMGLSMEDLAKLLSIQFVSQINDNKEEHAEQKEEANTDDTSSKKSTKEKEKDQDVGNNTGEQANLESILSENKTS